MATINDIARITRRSEALKSLSLGDAPQIEPSAFSRFPEMVRAVDDFNDKQKQAYTRLKNLLAEALLSARDIPP